MKVIRKDIDNTSTNIEDFNLQDYPRHDLGEVIGESEDVRYYKVVNEEIPDYNIKIETIESSYNFTDEISEESNFIYIVYKEHNIIPLELPTLEELKDFHLATLKDIIGEISTIVSACKNVYDPLRIDTTNIPEDLRNLISMVQGLRQRAIDEIKALSTQEEAAQYIIKGVEVEGYINMLKSFL